jgi:type I restriction-modification system DNA methylase subunit
MRFIFIPGLTPPDNNYLTNNEKPSGLVQKLERVQEQLRYFLLSVESGEYFHKHKPSFNPESRVDRYLLRNLKATREKLGTVRATRHQPQTIDALLCRLVFTCYLFDRKIIDRSYLKNISIGYAEHLRGILANESTAKKDLYTLFTKLGKDFNGDLFTDDLKTENELITPEHLKIIDSFFHATDIQTGQLSFLIYDFSFIPIETISSIYEHFLKVTNKEQKKEAGAFYTPRFLAEFVLDLALENEKSLLDKRFLDPACGSGIFLVGLFNRLAQEWKLRNSGANYNRRADGLINILRTNLFGVDINPSACRIAAFSLYLAFLDQLSSPDIQKLLGKWDRLPNLVYLPEKKNTKQGKNIYNHDFFNEKEFLPEKMHLIIGNPPWGSETKKVTPTKSKQWCEQNFLEHPNGEKSVPFIWKAPFHLENDGRVCFLLPHGILFNHSDKAISFQKSFFQKHAVDRVVNLADFRFFLFEQSLAPALIIQYSENKPVDSSYKLDYWAPKTDWSILQTEMISVLPQDRTKLKVKDILKDLNGNDGPMIWKKHFWATARDWRFLDRLSLMPRLRDNVGQQRNVYKRWSISEGFQPVGDSDNPTNAKIINISSNLFIDATSDKLNLFILESDCKKLSSRQVTVREKSNKNVEIYKAPHVLVTKGFSSIAFADFDVSFRHALRGIHGPESDRELLIFLTAFLRSDLAKYFLFHTSTNWGIYRPEVHVQELLRLPFPLPGDMPDSKRCAKIVKEVAAIVTKEINSASEVFSIRKEIVDNAQNKINKLVIEYFNIDNTERLLVDDTIGFTIPSIHPPRNKTDIPTIKQSNKQLLDSYSHLLCNRLNNWADKKYKIHCKVLHDYSIGIGIAVLEKTGHNENPKELDGIGLSVVPIINNLQKIINKNYGTYEIVRGLKIFDKNLLYITKPIGQRFWSQTAALNDADEIASTILMQSRGRK